jgi:hypothetical protein
MDFFREIEKETESWKAKVFPKLTREEMIADWEKRGLLDPNCLGCREFYESTRMPNDVFAPRHNSSHRPHCTCDFCW